jgi:hypothetical protein
MKSLLNALLVTTGLTAMAAPVAMAQDVENPFLRGRYTSVTERPQPEFDPLPIRAGAFNIRSSLGVAAEYNDNIFATPDNEETDTILRLTPEIEARSDWSVHEIAAGATVDHREYSDFGDESSTDYNVFLNGRLDATRNLMFRAGVEGGHFTEERYQAASFGVTERASFDRVGAFVQAIYRMDRYQLEGTVGTTEETFDQLDQQFRDNTANYVNARLSYAISPDVAVFVQGYSADLDYSSFDRDGTRSTVDAGVNFELAAPIRGEIAVGTVTDERDNPDFGTIDGLNVRANVEWFPTQLTTVTFLANRGVVDPGLATSASAINTTYGVRVDHELFRNILLFGSVRQETNEYGGLDFDREDEALTAAVGAAYKLNRHARFETQYSARSQDSTGADAGPDIEQNILSVGIRLYP